MLYERFRAAEEGQHFGKVDEKFVAQVKANIKSNDDLIASEL